MIRIAVACVAVGCVFAGIQTSAQEVQRSAHHDFRAVTMADGLDVPWSLAWLPDGDMLVTERPGRLRIVRAGTLLPDPVPGVPAVFARGQGGLFDVLLHPDFATNRLLYLSYARPKGEGSTTAVVRGRFENDRFTAIADVFESQSQGRGHYGGRLAWDRDGYLFVSVGDRMARTSGDLSAHPAQDSRAITGLRFASMTTAAFPATIRSSGSTASCPRSGATDTGTRRGCSCTRRPAICGPTNMDRKVATSST